MFTKLQLLSTSIFQKTKNKRKTQEHIVNIVRREQADESNEDSKDKKIND